MSILDEIFAHKRLEVAACKQRIPMQEVRQRAATAAPALDFCGALRAKKPGPALIAEVKKASPSRGLLAPEFNHLALAGSYQRHGAAAISVLTDENYFQGHLRYLEEIAQLPGRPPLLRKDFVLDPYQIYEARAAGADAILLIVAYLEPGQLQALQQLAHELGMAALVEVHTALELETALTTGATLVGINNRDLHTFTVSLETTRRLRPLLPADVCVVAESGIHTAGDVALLRQLDVDAMLVGESLVKAPDIGTQIGQLLGPSTETHPSGEKPPSLGAEQSR